MTTANGTTGGTFATPVSTGLFGFGNSTASNSTTLPTQSTNFSTTSPTLTSTTIPGSSSLSPITATSSSSDPYNSLIGPTVSPMSSPLTPSTTSLGYSTSSNSWSSWGGWGPPLPGCTSCTETSVLGGPSFIQGPTSSSWTVPSIAWASAPKEATSSINGHANPPWFDWSSAGTGALASQTVSVAPLSSPSFQPDTWTIDHTTVVSYTTIYLTSALPLTSTASTSGSSAAAIPSSSLLNSPASASFGPWPSVSTITVNPLASSIWNPAFASGVNSAAAAAAAASYTSSAMPKPRPGYTVWFTVLLFSLLRWRLLEI